MTAIFIKSTRTLVALHESDGKPGEFIDLYKTDGEFIERCTIIVC
ncbi:hypothetical protein [Acinetobacter sp. SwsAc6]|nr:hypothetical protein [Acinetobacter sp. SwsAc6]